MYSLSLPWCPYVCTYVHTSLQTVSVVQLLWNALVHLDDLSAATGSIMELLARLLAVSQQSTSGTNTAVQSDKHTQYICLCGELSYTGLQSTCDVVCN